MNATAAYLGSPRGIERDVTAGAAHSGVVGVHSEPCEPRDAFPAGPEEAPTCADEPGLVRVAGVSRSHALADILRWRPDAIYKFASHPRLNEYQEANIGVELTFIPLDDPTNTKPWYDADIEVLCRAAADARKSILAGKKVAFLCKAGLNRSPTLARMASHGMNIVGVAMPVDEALCELALCDLEDPSALAKLTPVGMRKQRKRSRPDA